MQTLSRCAGAVMLLGVSVVAVEAQTAPATYKSAADLSAEFAKAGDAAARVGLAIDVATAPGYQAVVRRRQASGTPQNAIIHPDSAEIYEIMDGGGVLVTGGVLDPPPGTETIQRPDIVTSTGIRGGKTQKVAKGDVVFVPAGTPHWFSSIDGTITYLEVRFRK